MSRRSKRSEVGADARRGFLKSALTATGAAAALAAGRAKAGAGEPTEDKLEVSKGYRETDHIRDYYKTTRI